ncbi:hypothetical protein V6N11_011996 [Hibiscus sabdariffa]|uniref:Secreted protein n=1 Tax=Hibiscus sabdariffa TaxID=183260 RepID=A0ABR2PA35_9ROSI
MPKARETLSLSFLFTPLCRHTGVPGGVKGDPINLFRPRIISSWAWSYFTVEKQKKASISKFNSDVARFFLVTSPAFGIPLLAVKVTTSGMASSRSVTGGELQPAIRTEDGFLELAHPRGIATLFPVHCSTCVAHGIRGMMA